MEKPLSHQKCQRFLNSRPSLKKCLNHCKTAFGKCLTLLQTHSLMLRTTSGSRLTSVSDPFADRGRAAVSHQGGTSQERLGPAPCQVRESGLLRGAVRVEVFAETLLVLWKKALRDAGKEGPIAYSVTH